MLQEKDKPEIKDLLSKVTIHIVPLVNADGFEYSRSTDRLWRKNRSTGSNGSGVDVCFSWLACVQ